MLSPVFNPFEELLPDSTDVALCLEFLVCILNVSYRLVVARKTPKQNS